MPKRETEHQLESGRERIQTYSYVEVFKLFAYIRGHVAINLKSRNEISVHSLVYLTFGHSNSKRLQTSIVGAIGPFLSAAHTHSSPSPSPCPYPSLCLPLWVICLFARMVNLKDLPPARTAFKCPSVRVIYAYMCVCEYACVCIPVTNTCVNLITTNWVGRKRGSTETE